MANIASIYSVRLFSGATIGPGSTLFFTAAAGKTTVIRCVSFTCVLTPANACNIYGNVFNPIAGVYGPQLYTPYVVNLRHVMNAGEQLWGESTGGSWQVVVSGYELD